ncbi:MAG TPA: alkaline phosphatase family protein, partial [Chitinophagales bacterium]|nr:alkaline phosphatase family protein [Chitinophagales bacterium]
TGPETDFLCVSFSSTDYVGHAYGPHSMEIQDTYLRLDKDLGELLTYLDTQVGKGNYLLFLTADHGVTPTPQYMESLRIPAGTTTEVSMLQSMQAMLNAAWGQKDWISAYTNQQIYLNDALLQAAGKTIEDAYNVLYPQLMKMDGVSYVLQINKLNDATMNNDVKELVINGIYPKRCGDIQILYEPYWFEAYRPTGTTHGSHFSYDTHVPLIFYGWKIKSGALHRNVYVTDIAATLADLLNISEPNACIGHVIPEVANGK